MLTLKIKKQDNLVNYLVNFEGLGFNKVKQLLRQKDIKVNGKRINSDVLVKLNDEVVLYAKQNYFFDIKVVFEDENVIIVDKPKKLEVISENKDIDLIKLININYFAVHRLDFNTEGLVVIAKNVESKNELDNAFKNLKVDKTYITICKNKPKQSEITFVDYLIKKDKLVKILDKKSENSKICKTKIQLLDYKNNFSLLKINLLTGRTHQIRAHLAFHNLFVLGDEKYGDYKTNKELGLKNQILKCINLKFNFEESSKLFYLNSKEFNVDFEKIKDYFLSL